LQVTNQLLITTLLLYKLSLHLIHVKSNVRSSDMTGCSRMQNSVLKHSVALPDI